MSIFNITPKPPAGPDLAAQLCAVNVGLTELMRRLIRIETRVCHLMEAANLDAHGHQKGTV